MANVPATTSRTARRSVATLAAARADTPANLLAFQRALKTALTRPLTNQDLMQERWVDGRPMAEFAAEFVKSNDRLTAVERLQIYNRMYWFRLIDCFHDDNPGLRAALGDRRFAKLAEAYLDQNPSRSFTLRNLCSRLEQFIRVQKKWTAPRTLLAIDIARFEWAQTVAFDEPGRPMLTGPEIAAVPPARLKLALQPYVTLLALNHPVDDYVIAVKQRDALRSESSNAANAARRVAVSNKVPLPRREKTFLAVHRFENQLYYKRLTSSAFKILDAIRTGQPLTRAIAAGGRKVTAPEVQEWFATWMQLGWFCRR